MRRNGTLSPRDSASTTSIPNVQDGTPVVSEPSNTRNSSLGGIKGREHRASIDRVPKAVGAEKVSERVSPRDSQSPPSGDMTRFLKRDSQEGFYYYYYYCF